MYCLCVNVYCHRVITQLQLINVIYRISDIARSIYLPYSDWGVNVSLNTKLRLYGNVSPLSRVFHGVVFTEAKRKFTF